MTQFFGCDVPGNVSSIGCIPGWTDGRILDVLAEYAGGNKAIVEIGSW
jgi:hypothetical protein